MCAVEKLKKKIASFCWWIWRECKDVKTLLLLLLVIVVVYCPVWGGFLLHWLFRWKWALAAATACLLFWAGPATPFFPLCVGLTLAIKKALQTRKNRKHKEE